MKFTKSFERSMTAFPFFINKINVFTMMASEEKVAWDGIKGTVMQFKF